MQRTLQHIGATLAVTSDRELAVYALASNRDSVGETLSLLASLTSNNSYRAYEFPCSEFPDKPINHRLKATLQLSPEEILVDMLGKAAFRAQPLGNSIYVPNYNVNKISADQVNAFVSATHGAGGLVVVGTGVDHGVLVSGAEALGLANGSVPCNNPTKYLGGDLRLETGGRMAHVAVVGEGAKVGGSDSLATEVAAQLLGGGRSVKYGNNSSSALLRALKAQSLIQGYSLSFSDTGLLGFSVRAPAQEAPKVVSGLVKAAKNLTVSDKDVAGAKARVKTALLSTNSGCGEVQRTGRQLLLTGSSVDVADAVKAIDAVSPADVTKAIARAFSGKLTVAAVGNVNDVPYSDTL
jgi:predicted Zn-dependent peptidase